MADLTWAPYLGQFFGEIASALSGGNPGLLGASQSVSGHGADMARNMEYQQALKEQEEAKKKQRRGKIFGTIGSMAAAAIPGVGPAASAALSAGAGALGQSIGEGKFIGLDRMLTEQALPSVVGYGIGKAGKNMGFLPEGNVGPAPEWQSRLAGSLSKPVVSQGLARLPGLMGDETDLLSNPLLLALAFGGL